MLPTGVTVFERGWLSSNNILIQGRGRTALVDSGYARHAVQTVALVGQALKGKLLDQLVNTHLHSDHCGGNAALQHAYPTLTTSIPPGDAAAVTGWDEDRLSFQSTGQDCPEFTHDTVLSPGSKIALGDLDWQIHAAPGHDPHSIMLFEPTSRTLISADALWQNGFGVVFPELEGEPSFGEVAATLTLIAHLRPHCVIPGHGAVFCDVDASLDRARNRLAGYRADPARHARHSAKVLVKFKLMADVEIEEGSFFVWARSTSLFETIRSRYFLCTSLDSFVCGLIAELVDSGHACRPTLGTLANA